MMLQQVDARTGRRSAPMVSAAFDPYEEERNSVVDDERLDQWLRHVEAELKRYRSPFVAAEALLTELRLHNTELYQPERLYVNTALRVLDACVPQLSKETAEVVRAAVHELLPCLVYTRRDPLANTAGLRARGPSETVTQLTYAGAFRRVLDRWRQFQAQQQQQSRMVRTEAAVLDRLVHALDYMWVKTCFLSWRTYCRQRQRRMEQLRVRLGRATANEAVPRFVRAWRQLAHVITLKAKTSRYGALQDQIEALYPQEHEAKSAHDHLSEEVREKERLVASSKARLVETEDRLRVLNELITETQHSLEAHWTTWCACMQRLFGDVGRLPTRTERRVRTDYLMNITDTAAALAKRARSKASRQGMEDIGRLLHYKGALTGLQVGETAGPAPPSSSPTAPTSSSASTAMAVVPATFTAALHTSAGTNDVCAAVVAVAAPVLSPLHLLDVLHHNEPQLQVTLTFLSSLYCGGHCSLFIPRPRLTDPQKGSAAAEKVLMPGPSTSEKGTNSSGEMQWGALMVRDIAIGMQKVQHCTDMNDRYLGAVRQCMLSSEMEHVQGYLEDLYPRFAATGVPLSQAKLEAVWEGVVEPGELPILRALYPSQGIFDFGELINYVTRIAEFSGRPLLSLAERLDAAYPYDPLDELRIVCCSEEAVEVFKPYADHIARLLAWLKEGGTIGQLRDDRVESLLEGRLGLAAGDVAEILVLVQQEGSDTVVSREEVELLLLLAAVYVDPSPFTTTLEKVSRLLVECAPFFQRLGKPLAP